MWTYITGLEVATWKCAFEWLFPSVGTRMSLELAAICESLAAFLALKRFLPAMTTLMALESCLSRKCFSTYRAVKILVCVQS
jgi:hypothetical protein